MTTPESQPKTNSGEEIGHDVSHEDVPVRATVKRPQRTRSAASRRKCANGHQASATAKFCAECGGRVIDPDAPAQCRNSHPVKAADKFCAECGVPTGEPTGVIALGGAVAAELPRPDSELTDEERAERARLHDQALRLGKETPAVTYAPGSAPSAETVVIHFLIDGFTAFGNVWMRGQEIELWPGHPRWAEAQSWITLDTAGQYSRFGRQVFGYGPWPGARSYTAGIGKFQQLKADGGDGNVAQPTEEELARADEAERRRGRRVPMPIG